ncbi:hypothetical protein MKZ38_004695 [Zalerion maritima]|uniref:Rhodopsin domain-containing protein n=1 Tax=Zalerion maritima TaxID=339359 RepID=A0AAD5RL87_9PEZI|nr:hypothetical protein MKZ38_004695 [Zalerion maritima]
MVAQTVVGLLVTSILFTSIALLTVIARLYTRFKIIKNAGIEEYLICISMAASIGFMVVVMYQIKYGLGIPFAEIPPENLMKFFQCLWATIPVYNFALLFVKLSIVCQYLRIFRLSLVQKLCKAMLGVLIVYGCWTVFGSIFMCVPVQFFWGEGEGTCMDKLAFWFSNAALNIATDILIFAIPIPLIKSLQIANKQKIALMAVFAFGAFVCVTSIIRLKSLYTISVSTDTSLDGVECAIWSGIEINVAIACSSMSTLKPLIGKLFPGLLSSRGRSTAEGPYANVSGSHQMKSYRGANNAKAGAEIQISQTIDMKTEDRQGSREGSDSGLVHWTAGCYSADSQKSTKGAELV